MAFARSTDPATSHEAAQEAERSGRAGNQRTVCLTQVQARPGLTAAEIAAATGLERHVPSRRLPELRETGLVENRETRLTVKVAHYPSGASKWNPIEHRLFSEISKNWAGRPLDSYDTILNYIRTTRTKTGLRLRAHLVRKGYEKGIQISDTVMRQLPLINDPVLPRWNYELCPC